MSTTVEGRSFIATLLSTHVYKASQGRMVRQVSLAVFLAVVFLGCYRMSEVFFQDAQPLVHLGIPALAFALGSWFVYRVVQWPKFADFLIAVQGELDKVNWATWEYLIRATGVVLVTMVIAAAFLWVCDFVWLIFFEFIGFLKATNSAAK